MSWVAAAVAGGSLLSGIMGADAAGDASDAQTASAQAGIDENRRQFDTVQKLLSPYVEAGGRGLVGYENLLGTNGVDAQGRAVSAIEQGPLFGRLAQQGNDAILANASATGGLRGGNTQAALANSRTDILSRLIDQQLGRFGQLAGVGQNSAAGVGNAALGTGNNVSALLQQQGAAEAGGTLAGTNAITRAIGNIGGIGATRFGAPGTNWQPDTSIPSAISYGGAGISGGGGFGSGKVFGEQDLGQYMMGHAF